MPIDGASLLARATIGHKNLSYLRQEARKESCQDSSFCKTPGRKLNSIGIGAISSEYDASSSNLCSKSENGESRDHVEKSFADGFI